MDLNTLNLDADLRCMTNQELVDDLQRTTALLAQAITDKVHSVQPTLRARADAISDELNMRRA